jgi:dUTPase
MVIATTQTAELFLVQQLNETQRSDGGFGHTGVK